MKRLNIWLQIILFLIIFISSQVNARVTPQARTHTDFSACELAVECYKKEVGTYPLSFDELYTNTNLKIASKWDGPYYRGKFHDYWRRPYVYRYPGKYNTNMYEIYTLGPDGKTRTDGNDPDDINSWDENKIWRPKGRLLFSPTFIFTVFLGGALIVVIYIFEKH